MFRRSEKRPEMGISSNIENERPAAQRNHTTLLHSDARTTVPELPITPASFHQRDPERPFYHHHEGGPISDSSSLVSFGNRPHSLGSGAHVVIGSKEFPRTRRGNADPVIRHQSFQYGMNRHPSSGWFPQPWNDNGSRDIQNMSEPRPVQSRPHHPTVTPRCDTRRVASQPAHTSIVHPVLPINNALEDPRVRRVRARNNLASIDNQLRKLPVPQPAGHPVIGDPDPDIKADYEVAKKTIIDAYSADITLCERAIEFNNPSHPQHDVFHWWLSRVLDRLDRKEESKIEFDQHEDILSNLFRIAMEMKKVDQSANESSSNKATTASDPFNLVINFFAEQVVPATGFTVEQVDKYRRDPKRWERRDKREDLWKQDPTGEMEKAWKEKQLRQSRENWDKVTQKRQILEEQREYARRRNNSITRARFDAHNRVGKGSLPRNRRNSKSYGRYDRHRDGSDWSRETRSNASLGP